MAINFDGPKGEVKVQEAAFTAMQEKATAFIFKRTYVGKKKFRSAQDIVKDKDTVKGLQKIFVQSGKQLFNYKYPFMQKIEQNWFETFYKQHKKILEVFDNAKFTIFDRDDKGGFMMWFQKLIKDYFGISQKDMYNPADIWLIDKKEVNRKVITAELDQSPKTRTIHELNKVMRVLYNDNKVVGLSLKLVSGKEAKYERVNLDEKFFKAIESGKSDYDYKLSEIKFDCRIKGEGKKTLTETQDIVFKMTTSTGKPVANFQIKGNDTKKPTNLKIEPSSKGDAARLGKAPLDLVRELTKQKPYITKLRGIYKFGSDGPFDNSRANFPGVLNKTPSDKEKRAAQDNFKQNQAEYKKYFNALLRAPAGIKVDTGGVTSDKVFVNNMMKAFLGPSPWIVTHKLMELKFAYMVISLKNKEMIDEYMTDLVFLAMKAGRKVFPFGPFGKLS